MCSNKVLFALLVLYWLYSVGESGVVGSREASRLAEVDGYDSSELDCSRFKDDFDLVRQLPFPVLTLPRGSLNVRDSLALLDKTGTFIEHFVVRAQKTVPRSIFCLTNITMLYVDGTPFEDGIVPDALANLKSLRTFVVQDSPVKKITAKLRSHTTLRYLSFSNCSLTSFPDLTNLTQLTAVILEDNHLAHLDGTPAVQLLYLSNNNFTEIPLVKNSENLIAFTMSQNPLKNITPALSFKNLQLLFVENINLASVPAEIDQMLTLEDISFAGNQLTSVPTSVLNLPRLRFLNITGNPLSSDDITSIKKFFETSRPNVELVI